MTPTSSPSPSHGYVHRSTPPRRAARPISPDDDLLPPDLGDPQNSSPEDTSFRAWLAAGLLDLLGTAAGVTLSTTGRLVAPPLHVTRTVLLPAILDLIVDTLDSITPQKVQDWFRILTSSFHHLMVVLRSTEKGQEFSGQLYLVLQDFLQAASAPESRQVLVESMATSVKLIDAMHTPETKEFLEQLATLGVRILDAAASGKAKQLIQNSKDLAWKGIEMATEPATTVALAEVTAHLCHALEDANETLNPTVRARRNAQTQALYINPYQMVDSPEQVCTEELILNGLGVKVYSDEESDWRRVSTERRRSSTNRVRWKDEVSQPLETATTWQDSKEKVNVALLRESILRNKGTRASKIEPGSIETFPELVSKQPADEMKTKMNNVPDMEDIKSPGRPQRQRQVPTVFPEDISSSSSDLPQPVRDFYAKLDEFLENNRVQTAISKVTSNADGNASEEKQDDSEEPSRQPRANKLKRSQRLKVEKLGDYGRRRGPFSSRFESKRQIALLLMGAASVSLILSILGLALVGLFSLLKLFLGGQQTLNRELDEEAILRIVQEILRAKEATESTCVSS